MILISLFLVNCVFGRLLQKGQRGQPHGNQQNQNINQTFNDFFKNLDQDQKENLEVVESYVLNEGMIFYGQAPQAQKDKIKQTFFGMIDELDKQDEKGEERVEQDIEYFSSLNSTDKDIVLTMISYQLHKTLNDTSKQFNSQKALQIIEEQIEEFKLKGDRSIASTWNTDKYLKDEELKEKYFEELVDQIEEQLDQGLSKEQIAQNLTVFLNKYFNDETVNVDLVELIQKVKEEQKHDSTAEMKKYRQQVRQMIRDLLKQGKTEEQIEEEVNKFLNEKGFENLTEQEKENLRMLIHKEFVRFKRQQQQTENNNSSNTDSADTDIEQQPATSTASTDNSYITYICVFGGILIVILVGFAVRRQIVKMRQNAGNKTGFSIPESGHDIEQMD